MALAYENTKTLNECSQADLDGSPLKLWEQIRAMEDELKIARGRHNTASTARDILIKEDQERRCKFGELLWENPWLGTPSWDDILFRVEIVSHWQDQAEEVRAKLGDVRKERDEWKEAADRRLRLAKLAQEQRDQWREQAENPVVPDPPVHKMLEERVEIQQAEIDELNEKLRIAQGSAGQLTAKVGNQRKEITRLLAEKDNLRKIVADLQKDKWEFAQQVRKCKRHARELEDKLEEVRKYVERNIRVSDIGRSIMDILDD
jgi:hypothetical protein